MTASVLTLDKDQLKLLLAEPCSLNKKELKAVKKAKKLLKGK